MAASDFQHISIMAGQVFQPSGPIQVRKLFAGRQEQLTTIMDAVNSPGQHVVLYGERGVGKSSLANIVTVMPEVLGMTNVMVARRVVLSKQDDFASSWRKLFEEVIFTQEGQPLAFQQSVPSETTSLMAGLPEKLGPDDVRRRLGQLKQSIFIFDEFDRVDTKAVEAFADLLKMLSDYNIAATVILVGVSGTAVGLIRQHESVQRCVTQVKMPRMSPAELREILDNAAKELSVAFEEQAIQRIVALSQGLPHYTHSLGLYSVRAAAKRQSTQVSEADVEEAINTAVMKTEDDITTKCHAATHSTHPKAIYGEVLLACSMAEKDELGYFQANKVVDPLQQILGREITHATFARHLTEFCQADRGPVLECEGGAHRKRYRFTDTMMPPYIIMKGYESGMLSD